MLMLLKVVSGFWAAGTARSSHKNSKRQDAREGGESPPLPRNCERSMPGCSSFRQDFGRILFLVLEKIEKNH
jgi:hypothetical protein